MNKGFMNKPLAAEYKTLEDFTQGTEINHLFPN